MKQMKQMKQIYFLLTISIFSCIKLHAQLTDVVTGINEVTSIEFNGDELYYIYGEFPNNRKLAKININTNVVTDLLDVPGAYGLILVNDYLFVSGNAGISKIDLTQATLSLTKVIADNSINYRGMAIKNNDIYVGSLNSNIYKFDLTNSNPTLVTVTTDVVSSYGIAIKGDELFIADYKSDLISKIDLSSSFPTTPASVISVDNPLGMVFRNNTLYISSDPPSNIYSIDVEKTSPVLTSVINSGLSGPDIGLAFKNDDLFIAEYFGDKISKYSSSTLNIKTNEFDLSSIKIYPNPATNFIQISGLTEAKKFSVSSILGSEIKKGTISNNEKLDIQNLNNGLYFMRFENGNTIKFLKE